MVWFFIILAFIFPPVGIPVLIFYFLRQKKGSIHPSQDKNWYLELALSREDAVSQWFLLLSVFFLGITLLAINRDIGDPLSWQTIILVTSLTGLAITYYFRAVSSLIFSLFGIASWWGFQAIRWIEGKDIKTSSIFVGVTFIALLFYVVGHFHEREQKTKRFAVVYMVIGIIFITGVLLSLSSQAGLMMLAQMTKGASFFGSWEITTSLFIFFTSFVGLVIYLVSKKLLFVAEAAGVLVLSIIFGITAFLPQQNIFLSNSQLSGSGVVWAILFNLAVFFELLGLIFSGYLRKEEWLINLGTIFLFLLIIIKYFDWFFTFLDKSVFFIGAGILLFGVGWFMEKSRRYMIDTIAS